MMEQKNWLEGNFCLAFFPMLDKVAVFWIILGFFTFLGYVKGLAASSPFIPEASVEAFAVSVCSGAVYDPWTYFVLVSVLYLAVRSALYGIGYLHVRFGKGNVERIHATKCVFLDMNDEAYLDMIRALEPLTTKRQTKNFAGEVIATLNQARDGGLFTVLAITVKDGKECLQVFSNDPDEVPPELRT